MEKHLFPLQVWAYIVTRLDLYPGLTDDTPVNIVWLENHNTNITFQITTRSLRSVTLSLGEERLGLSHKEVVTHSLQSGFAMKLFLEKLYPETIMIIGIWSSNVFLKYIWIQVSNISKGISDLVVSTSAFYTITRAEVIDYIPGQPGVQYHRLNPQQVITSNTTSYLLLPLSNSPQVSNTHATLS